ncbi:MAG TPA: outer membrane protein assembly factor BamE [Burkholderiales bacterium]|nr:outer membrane protein assembly factor BamE [Burkholderiales bacterium]
MNRLAPLALAAITLLAACGSLPRIPGVTPYRIDIQQGNYVTQEMVSQLKAGMTKEQVQNTLGTPLLTDVFHADRWDYVYSLDAADGRREGRKLTVYFQDGKLARVEGDVVPAAPKEGAAKDAPAKAAAQ